MEELLRDGDRTRLLIVEDDADIRESLLLHLSGEGYDVTVASSGNEAIPLTYGREFDLALLDLRMPYIDGFELLKFIKGTFAKTRVIILTAYADLTNIQKCKNLGADEVTGKPYNLEYLFTIIREVLKKNSLALPETIS